MSKGGHITAADVVHGQVVNDHVDHCTADTSKECTHKEVLYGITANVAACKQNYAVKLSSDSFLVVKLRCMSVANTEQN